MLEVLNVGNLLFEWCTCSPNWLHKPYKCFSMFQKCNDKLMDLHLSLSSTQFLLFYSYTSGGITILFSRLQELTNTKRMDDDVANNLVKELECRIRVESGQAKSTEYLLHRLSVAVQRGNSVSMIGSTGG